MRLYKILIVLFLFTSTALFAQKSFQHTVQPGETLYSIAKMYDVKEKAIKKLNPKLKKKKIQINAVLEIPYNKKAAKKRKKRAPQPAPTNNSKVTKTHIVKTGETLYSISKKYGVSIQHLQLLNPQTVASLPIGYKLIIKGEIPAATLTALINTNKPKTHTVKKGETLYSISKKYNLSIAEIQQLNPQTKSGLPVGYQIILNPQNAPPPQPIAVERKPSKKESSQTETLIKTSKKYLGTRYRSGGTTKKGFDCSGLMLVTYKGIGMNLPRSSSEQAKVGKKIKRSKAKKGDLIFFATGRSRRINHVGMVTEAYKGEIKFIHASTSLGVIVSSTKEPYYAKRFVQVNKVL